MPQPGASHHDSHKPPLAQIPGEPLREVALVLAFGAKKYGAHNWRGGSEWTRYASSALRHIFAWLGGEDRDPESGCLHLAHAICNLMFIMEWQRTDNGTDDRHTD